MKKFAVILAGSGVFDGSEIHEVTLTLLAIQQAGGEYQCFAPDIMQHHVLDHITGNEMDEKRNVLIESARIARGKVKNIKEFDAADFDVLMIPGGFGVAKNLCDFAFKGSDCSVNREVAHTIKTMHEARKPIGALCVSPVLVSKVLGDIKLTLGQDEATIKQVEKMGSRHVKTTHGEVIIDEKNKVFTTPCYMLDANIGEIWEGASNIVRAILNSIN
jgi:enhancing lycopene biosynthesis protein 2